MDLDETNHTCWWAGPQVIASYLNVRTAEGWRWEEAKEALVCDTSAVWSRKMWENVNPPINGEKARWGGGGTMAHTLPAADECPFCPGKKESELHIFRCPEYLHLCDCESSDQHTLHDDLDIITLIKEMRPETCNYIHNSLTTRRQRLVEIRQ